MWYRKTSNQLAATVLILPALMLVVFGFGPTPPPANSDRAEGRAGLQQTSEHQAELTALGESGVSGQATFTVSGDTLSAILEAEGLAEGQHAQHIHEGASCSSIGGVLVPLEPFPTANAEGTVSYKNLTLEAPENLADRTVVMHGTDGTPVACGPINPSDDS